MAGKKGRSGRLRGSTSRHKNPLNIVVHHAQALLDYWRAVTGRRHASSLVRLRACEKAVAHIHKVYANKIQCGEMVMPTVERVLEVVTEQRRPAIGERGPRKAANEAYVRRGETLMMAWKGEAERL